MNLYEIDNEIMNCFDEETGEILDCLKLNSLQMERDSKIENIGCYIKNLLAEAEALKTEKLKLSERQRRAENKAKSLKTYLTDYLDGEKFSTAKVAISYRKSESVEVKDIELLPEWAVTIKAPEPNKVEIKRYLKSGETLDGVELVQNLNIQIK